MKKSGMKILIIANLVLSLLGVAGVGYLAINKMTETQPSAPSGNMIQPPGSSTQDSNTSGTLTE